MTPQNIAPVSNVAPLPRTEPAYKRILLKLSGEALMGNDPYGINREVIDRIVAEIGNPALALFVLGEIVAAGRKDRAGEPGALGPEELGMGDVGRYMGGARRMPHQIDAVRVGAQVRGLVGNEAYRCRQILVP